MPETLFDRDTMANWYVERHFPTDPGVRRIDSLKTNAPEPEMRLLEVNDLIVERDADPFESLDFGVDPGNETGQTLVVLDVTPAHWEKIQSNEFSLLSDWLLESAEAFSR